LIRLLDFYRFHPKKALASPDTPFNQQQTGKNDPGVFKSKLPAQARRGKKGNLALVVAEKRRHLVFPPLLLRMICSKTIFA